MHHGTRTKAPPYTHNDFFVTRKCACINTEVTIQPVEIEAKVSKQTGNDASTVYFNSVYVCTGLPAVKTRMNQPDDHKAIIAVAARALSIDNRDT